MPIRPSQATQLKLIKYVVDYNDLCNHFLLYAADTCFLSFEMNDRRHVCIIEHAM